MTDKERSSRRRNYSRSKSYTRSRSNDRGRTKSRSRSAPRRSRSRSPRYSHNSERNRNETNNSKPTNVLGIFGLHSNTHQRDVTELFSKYGRINEVKIVLDGKTGRSRGFGFIYFDKTDDAIRAKEALHGYELDGRRIRIDYSLTKHAHSPTPGIYMGFVSRHSSKNGYHRRSPRRSPHYRRSRYSRSRSYERRQRRSPSPYYR